jgi:hypothetical protein
MEKWVHYSFTFSSVPLTLKMRFVEQVGRHMGSKSLVAAPLWVERYFGDSNYYYAMQKDNAHNSNSA